MLCAVLESTTALHPPGSMSAGYVLDHLSVAIRVEGGRGRVGEQVRVSIEVAMTVGEDGWLRHVEEGGGQVAAVRVEGEGEGVHAVGRRSVECPEECGCSGTEIRCESRGLSEVPSGLREWGLSVNVTSISLFNNGISELPEGLFRGMVHLEYL